MSATLFGTVSLTANVPAVLATGQPNTDSTLNIIINNHTQSSVVVYAAYVLPSSPLTTPSPQNFLSPLITLLPGANKEFKGIALQAGYSIVVGSDTTGVTAISYGFMDGTE